MGGASADSTTGPRWALVTGAASGIGRAIASRLRAEGWSVAAFDLNVGGESVGGEDLRELDGYPVFGVLDVRDEAAWAAAMAQLSEASGGRLHLLVNNAGVGGAGFLEDLPAERLRAILDTNLLGPMLGVRAALPLLVETAGSRVAFVGSMMGAHGAPQASAYAASKAGVRSLAESLQLELERHGIGVLHLMPGFVDTPFLDSGRFSGGEDMERGGLLRPEDVAEALVRGIKGGRLHVTVGKDASWMVGLARWWPGLLRWGMRRGGG